MLRKTIVGALALLTSAAILASDADARPNNRDWELLGAQSVGFGVDRDVVNVGRQDGDFRKIQVRVKGNAIEMLDLKVVYGNGQSDDIPVRENIRAGGKTRAIDLKGGERFIKNVQFIYRSKPNFRGQAVVEVWGRD